MNSKQLIFAISASILTVGSIGVGGYYANRASIQQVSTKLALAEIYSHIDKAANNELRYSSDDYEAIIAMGGTIGITNHYIAKGGLCEAQLKSPSTFEAVSIEASKHLTVDEKGKQKTNYSALVEVSGSPESLNVNAKTFSTRLAKDLRQSLDELISCHKALAESATIKQLQG